MKKSLLLQILFLMVAISVCGQNNDSLDSGIIYGKDHAYSLSAPEGWVLDNQSGTRQGLHAVFYPEGGSWRYSPVAKYTNVVIKEYSKVNSAKTYVAQFEERYQKENSDNNIVHLKNHLMSKGKDAIVNQYYDGKHGNHELVAYIDEDKVIVMVVYFTNDFLLFEQSKGKFFELLDSYLFITNEVKLPSS